MNSIINILITVTPFLNFSGSIPHEFVSRHLARHLIEQGFNVSILAPEELSYEWSAGVQIINGSITNPQETPHAFEGIDVVFLAGAIPETVYEAVCMAKEAGVKKIVTLSSHGPEIEIQFTPDCWYWLAIDVVVERSGISHTRIVPTNIMASTLVGDHYSAVKDWAYYITNDIAIQEPYAQTKVPLIHEEDLALVILNETLQVNQNSKTLHVYGNSISPVERIEILRSALQKEIKFKELSTEEAMSFYLKNGIEEEEVTHILSVLESISENPIEKNPKIEKILGRPLKTYEDWVIEHAAYFE